MKKIKERIHNCEKYGECEMTKKYYKNIEKMYLSHGVTEKDVDLYIKWTENTSSNSLKNKKKRERTKKNKKIKRNRMSLLDSSGFLFLVDNIDNVGDSGTETFQ